MRTVQSGRGFEYAIAYNISSIMRARLEDNTALAVAHHSYDICSEYEQKKMDAASQEVSLFLVSHDTRLEQNVCTVRIQSDITGVSGDVRDIVIDTPHGSVGISAKNRHHAVKHSRLSGSIDFGHKWMKIAVSQDYWHQVTPIFEELRDRKNSGQLWEDITDKEDRIYVPILHAFNNELQRIYNTDSSNAAKRLMHYLLGEHDYYKVAKINGQVSIQSFNMRGTLKWGRRFPLPDALTHISLKKKTTLLVSFDQGWQLSFRIHNASKKVEPSLKFDVQIVGLPQKVGRQESDYMYLLHNN